MKIKLYMILSSFLSIMTLSSCLDASSLMDKEDVGDLYEKDVFKDPTYARYFVNDIYYFFANSTFINSLDSSISSVTNTNSESTVRTISSTLS